MFETIKYWGRNNLLVYVTSRCNYSCIHCFYKKRLNDHPDRLSIDNIRRIIHTLPKYRLMSFTGGEPFLREDLDEFAFFLTDLLDTEELEVNTNASLPAKISKFADGYCERYGNKRKLLFQISLMGPQDIHDSITGVKGSFQKLDETVRALGVIRKKHASLSVCFCAPIMRTNYTYEKFFFEYARANDIPVKFSPLKSYGVTVKPACRDQVIDEFKVHEKSLFLTIDENIDFLKKLEEEAAKRRPDIWPEKDRLRNYSYVAVRSGRYLGDCRFRKKNHVIFSNGDYTVCEFLKPVGNIFDDKKNPGIQVDRINGLIRSSKGCSCAHGSYIFKNMSRSIKTDALFHNK